MIPLVIVAKSAYIFYGNQVFTKSFLKENNVSDLLNFSFSSSYNNEFKMQEFSLGLPCRM